MLEKQPTSHDRMIRDKMDEEGSLDGRRTIALELIASSLVKLG